MNKISYLEELKRGNKTLTDKVRELELRSLSLKKENTQLMKDNHVLEIKVRELTKQRDEYKKRLSQYESQNPLSYLEQLFNKI